MIKYFILLGLLICLKANAGINCELELAHTEDLRTPVAKSQIKATDSDLKSLSIKEFFVESRKGNKVISLAVNAVVAGWSGEEELTIAMFRRRAKKENVSLELISQKISVRGNAEETLWFDSYKLDIKCFVSRSEAQADS